MGYNDKYPDMSAMYAFQFEYENKLKDKIKELETELERTRKALDVAVDALKDIRCIYTGDQTTKPSTMFGRAAGALNKIQELEQKEKNK